MGFLWHPLQYLEVIEQYEKEVERMVYTVDVIQKILGIGRSMLRN